MRLPSKAITTIREAAKNHFGAQAKVWLFGSRVDDSKRGGDIDLYVEMDTPIKDRILKACRMNAEIQTALGEQKIDIVVSSPERTPLRIHKIAKQTGMLL
jgi:predicted nucleotidyltransferase